MSDTPPDSYDEHAGAILTAAAAALKLSLAAGYFAWLVTPSRAIFALRRSRWAPRRREPPTRTAASRRFSRQRIQGGA